MTMFDQKNPGSIALRFTITTIAIICCSIAIAQGSFRTNDKNFALLSFKSTFYPDKCELFNLSKCQSNPLPLFPLKTDQERFEMILDSASEYIDSVLFDPSLKIQLMRKWIILKRGVGDSEIVDLLQENWRKKDIKIIVPPYKMRNFKGLTIMDSDRIVINRFVFEMGYRELAGTIIHEYLHIIGFKHIRLMRSKSVPYQIGNLIAK